MKKATFSGAATGLCGQHLGAGGATATAQSDTLSDIERAQPVTPKMKGSLVLRAQVLLDHAHFSSGEIDAAYGQNLRHAISG